MAKLIIYRGDTLDREIDLGERNARVGRGDQNDIVLPDPAKSVSRFHAELRFENGAYSIVDLNSQNGTWVAGRRVPQATLEPGVPVVVGTYRLILKPEAPSPVAPEATEATLVAAPPVAEPSSAATMVGAPRPAAGLPPPPPPPAPKVTAPSTAPKPEPPPAPRAEAPKEAARPEPPKPAPPPVKAEPPKPPAPPPAKVEPPKPPAPPPAKVEPPKPPAPPVAARPASAPKPAGKGMSKGLLFGGFAILALAVMVAAVFLTPLKNQLAGLTGSQPAATATPADAPPPAAQPVPEPPREAPPPATTRAPEPTPAGAPARAVREPGGTAPVARPRERPASGGGRRGAAAAEAKPKPLNLAQTLETARSAMIKGDYLAAIAGFEAILKVDPKYPSAADLLGVARGGAKNASQLAVDSGDKAAMSGDYSGAQKQYERAQQLDPDSTAAPDAMRRLKARMQSEGEDAFRRARQYDALGRAQDAISMYEKAIQLLPPDHASTKTARERLAVLKGGL